MLFSYISLTAECLEFNDYDELWILRVVEESEYAFYVWWEHEMQFDM